MKTFDELVELHKQDPKAFEEYRQTFIAAEIDRMTKDNPELRQRLSSMQWRLEVELDRAGDDRYNVMVSKFWEGVAKFKESLQ